MPQQNKIIPNNDNEVLGAMDSVAKAHGQMANADMQQMAMYGDLDKDVMSTESTFATFMSKDNYYNSVGDAQGYMAISSQIASSYKDKMKNPISYDDNGNQVNTFDYLNNINKSYHNKISGLAQNINDNKSMPDSIKARVLNEINKSKQGVSDAYNTATMKHIGSQELSNFNITIASVKNDGYHKAEVTNLIHNANSIFANPQVSQQDKQGLQRAIGNIHILSTNPDFHTQTLPQSSNEHVNDSLNNEQSNKALDNTIKGLFLTHTNALQNIDFFKTDPSITKGLVEQFSNLQDIKTNLSNSHNMITALSSMKNSNSVLEQRVSNQLLPLINDKGIGDVVLRGFDTELNNDYTKFTQNPNPTTWGAYHSRLVMQAKHNGIPMSKLMDLPQDVNEQLNTVNADFKSPVYSQEITSTYDKAKQFMGDSPVMGTTDNANGQKLYNYGDPSKIGFDRFIANNNPKYGKMVNYLYKQQGNNQSEVTEYINKQLKNLKIISLLTQIPQDKITNTVESTYQDMVNNGISDPTQKVNDILQGYVAGKDVGTSYILPSSVFTNLGVTDPKEKESISKNAISLAYDKHINDIANQQYSVDKSVGLDSIKTRLKYNMGDKGDYKIIISNGNYFAYDVNNGKEFSLDMAKDKLVGVNDTTLKSAKEHFDNIKNNANVVTNWWQSPVSTGSSIFLNKG